METAVPAPATPPDRGAWQQVRHGVRLLMKALRLVLRGWRRLIGAGVALILVMLLHEVGAGLLVSSGLEPVVVTWSILAVEVLLYGLLGLWLWFTGWRLAIGRDAPAPRLWAGKLAGHALVLLAIYLPLAVVVLMAITAFGPPTWLSGAPHGWTWDLEMLGHLLGPAGSAVPGDSGHDGALLPTLLLILLGARLFVSMPALMSGVRRPLRHSWGATGPVWIVAMACLAGVELLARAIFLPMGVLEHLQSVDVSEIDSGHVVQAVMILAWALLSLPVTVILQPVLAAASTLLWLEMQGGETAGAHDSALAPGTDGGAGTPS